MFREYFERRRFGREVIGLLNEVNLKIRTGDLESARNLFGDVNYVYEGFEGKHGRRLRKKYLHVLDELFPRDS